MTRSRAPFTPSWRKALCAVVLALPVALGAAAGRDQASYRQARDGAKAIYDAQRRQCRGMPSGNAKDICVAQAKANRVHAEAKADSTYWPGDRTRLVAARHVAEADYKLAREKCDAHAGSARAACLKEARAALVAAKANARAAYGK